MNTSITIKDKQFRPYITQERVADVVRGVAKKINAELKNDFPFFVVVLNGAFMFAADLLREITIPCGISFIKVASYQGTTSSGKISELIGLNEDIAHRNIVIVEDIVDTGVTLEHVTTLLRKREAGQIRVATLLMKRGSYTKDIPVDYVGFEIDNRFVVGYGLDYEGMGRNLKDLHILA